MSTLLIVIGTVWLSIGLVLSLVLGRRGHDGFSWFLLGLMLGPLAIALAFDSWRHDEVPEAHHLASPGVPAGSGRVDVLVGFDGSAEAHEALTGAVELLGSRLGRLTLATVIPFDGGRDAERAAVSALEQEAKRLAWLTPGVEIVRGHPATALSAQAAEDGYELLAIGTRGSGRARLFGSAASELARTSKVPVLLVGPGAAAA